MFNSCLTPISDSWKRTLQGTKNTAKAILFERMVGAKAFSPILRSWSVQVLVYTESTQVHSHTYTYQMCYQIKLPANRDQSYKEDPGWEVTWEFMGLPVTNWAVTPDVFSLSGPPPSARVRSLQWGSEREKEENRIVDCGGMGGRSCLMQGQAGQCFWKSFSVSHLSEPVNE